MSSEHSKHLVYFIINEPTFALKLNLFCAVFFFLLLVKTTWRHNLLLSCGSQHFIVAGFVMLVLQ